MNIIAPLMIIVTIIAITNLNKKTRPEYVKNYNFKRDFIRDNIKLVILISLTLYFILIEILN